MDYVGELQSDSWLLLLLVDNSGVDDRGHGSGENDNCLLECDPLSWWDPSKLRDLLLVQDTVEGTWVTIWATFELGVPVDEVFL